MSVDALIEAAKNGDADTVRALLAGSASLAAGRAASGETALIAALYRGHAELASELADAAVTSGQRLDLFAAAALGRVPAIEAALAAGEPVDGHSYDGWTPLHLAAFFGRTDAAVRLFEAGAPLSPVSHNALKNTPLHAALAGGHVDLALMLVERGADVTAPDSGGHTPLHIAAESGMVAAVKTLLARGADPHAVDAEDKTPLSRAAARNHAAVVDAINLSR